MQVYGIFLRGYLTTKHGYFLFFIFLHHLLIIPLPARRDANVTVECSLHNHFTRQRARRL